MIAIMAGLALTAATAGAQITLFTDDFESPDVTAAQSGSTGSGGTSKIADTAKWVRSAQGFGSGANGIEDEGAGRFTDPVGEQAYRFCYTNSGVTTKDGVIGKLQLGVTYTVTVDVVRDGTTPGAGLPYNVQLLAVAPGAARDDCRSLPTGSFLLNSKSGNATNDGLYSTQTLAFTADCSNAGIVGYDLALRFIGATESANVDNVEVEADYSSVAFWNIGGATPSGSWTDTKWNTLPDGTGTDAVWTPGLTPVFSAGSDATGSYTVTVDGTHNISGLIHEEGTLILANGASGTLNFSADSDFIILSGLSATIGVPLADSGTQAFEKCGAGTLVLSADNSGATGPVSVSDGVLQVESTSALSGGVGETVTLQSGGTLALGASFGGANIPATLDRIVTTSAGTVAADNYGSTNFDFSTAALTAARLGAVGSVNYTGTLTPQGTTYRIGGGGGTLTMANTNALTGAGNSAIVSGNVVLAASNDYDGGTTLNSGTLTLGNAGSLGSSALTIAGGSIAATGTVVTSNTINANANVTVAGSGALTLGGEMTLNANRTITNNNTDATTTFGNITGTNRSLTFNGSGNTTVSGNITTGNQGLTKNNSGELRLEGANTYSGTTTVSGGKLILAGSNNSGGATTVTLFELHLASSSNGGLASGNLTFGNGTQFNAVIRAVDADRTISNNLILNNNHGSIVGDHSLTVNGSFTNTGGNRTLTNSIASGKSLTLAGTVNLSNDGTNRTLTVTGTGNTIINGVVANGGTATASALIKSGAGTLTLTNDNTYAGNTTVNSPGALALVGGSQDSVITVNNGAFIGFTLGSPSTSNKALNLGATAKVRITGTVNNSSSYKLMTASNISATLDSETLETPITDYELQLLAGNTELWLVYTGVGGNPYTTWSGGAAANVDSNGDGVTNGVAWALGAADPFANAIGLLPTLDDTSDPTYVIFEFERADLANDDPNTTITVEYGTDLAGWTTAVDDNNNVEIEVTPGSPTDTVVVKLKRSTLGAGGKLFARLNVVVTTP